LPFWQKQPYRTERKRLLAKSYQGMGSVALSGLNPDLATESLSAAFRIFGDSPTGDEDHDRMLIDLYLESSSTFNELGRQSQALEEDRKATALAEALVQRSPYSVPVHRSLFLGYQEAVLVLSGRDALNVGDSRQAQVYARKALAIAQAIAVSDSGNAQAQFDLSTAYALMGDSFRQSDFEKAAAWYRKSILLTKELFPLYGTGAKHWLAIVDEDLAEVLEKKEQAPERLQLLLEANQMRRELAETSPHGRLHLMRSYCKLSDAEIAVGNIAAARQYAAEAQPFFSGFATTSPSLLVLRDIGFCFASEAELQHRLAINTISPPGERLAAETESRNWYKKSAAVWTTWDARDAATPESERERRTVERALKRPDSGLQQALTKQPKIVTNRDRNS
jgi:eukaryotic-like serine/threonine-protein kinase